MVSEDLACIAAGVLVRDGEIAFVTATLACATGIFVGDVGLWSVGRAAGWLGTRSPRLARWLARLPLPSAKRWLERHAAVAMIASRFTPGTRLPLYIGAGLSGMSLLSFTAWAGVAVMLWTPAIVWAASGAREAVDGVLAIGGWPSRIATVFGLFLVLRTAHLVVPVVARAAVVGRETARVFERWRRWEFWPQPVFYAPVALWVVMLALRYRGVSTITASNPGIPDGGLVGESKFDILRRLPADAIIASALLPPSEPGERVRTLLTEMSARGWAFPLVLKPDVGQRGAGVRIARSEADVRAYCERETGAILVQPYHEGPYEAGVFYYRRPGDARGRIFSITDKHFPALVGDGHSTVEALILAHPRYRRQRKTFFARHAASLDRVLACGERMPLALAGNHAQGTMFRDGAHLWTLALEARVDAIARSYPGFFIGRFDVRYSDVGHFRSGTDLAVVELNGAAAESTSIYDPDRSLLAAYRELFRQWQLVFAIGAANRASGAAVTPTRRLCALVWAHLHSRPAFAVSD